MNRIASVAAVVLPLLLAACSDAPVAPKATRQFSTVSDAVGKVARWKNGAPRTDSYFASATIGPWGGRLSLAGFEVIVPPGAVSGNTNFTITLPAESWNAGYVWASFGPHGMQFNGPVILRAPFSGTNAEGFQGVHVVWFDGTTWVKLPSIYTADGKVSTLTYHFSDYGTEEPADSTGRGPTCAGCGN